VKVRIRTSIRIGSSRFRGMPRPATSSCSRSSMCGPGIDNEKVWTYGPYASYRSLP